MAAKVGYFCAYPNPAACEPGMEALWGRVEEGADLRCAHVRKVKTVASCAHMCCHDNSAPSSLSHQVEGAGHLRTLVLSPLPLPTARTPQRRVSVRRHPVTMPLPRAPAPHPTLARPNPNSSELRACVAPSPDPGHQPSSPGLALRSAHRSAE